MWFTDPPFGIGGHWEGEPAEAELPHAVYRIAADGKLQQVLADLAGSNGLAFSPDEALLYVVESRSTPHRKIWAYDHARNGSLSNKRLVIDARGAGAIDGIAIDVAGNLWCGWGSDAGGANSEALDGVRVYTPDGTAIGHIHLPERCANVCFGAAAPQPPIHGGQPLLYALYVNTQGAD